MQLDIKRYLSSFEYDRKSDTFEFYKWKNLFSEVILSH